MTPRGREATIWPALTIWLGIAMSSLDAAICNIALPTIAADLGAGAGEAIWVISAYQLVIAMLLLPFAALGDRIGYGRVYLSAFAVFVAGSLLCVLAPSLPLLVGARVIQGIGAAGILAMNMAVVREVYPPERLGRGIARNALVLSLSASLGPTIAAGILALGSWPWLFAVNLPLGLVALAAGWRTLPRGHGHGRPTDYGAALLSAAMMGGIVYGAERFSRDGAPPGLVLLAAGALAGVALVLRERHVPAPLFPLDLLRIPVISLTTATCFLAFAAQSVAFVVLPFLMQRALGISIVGSGLLMTAWPLAVGLAAQVSGPLSDRRPAAILTGGGLILLAVGLFSLALLGKEGATDWAICWRLALCGVGFGFFQAPNIRMTVSATPMGRTGAAGGLNSTARLLGQTCGAVIVGAGFHRFGIGAAPALLAVGAAFAAAGALASLLRLAVRVPAPLTRLRPPSAATPE